MSEYVCRAMTFINYHIPLTAQGRVKPNYITLGFFDGLITNELEMNYEENDLNTLWKYNLEKTLGCEGKFSYQNIFCFSVDDWNECTDKEFWSYNIDAEYPLTFVVFLQLKEYMCEIEGVRKQCGKIQEYLKKTISSEGKYYVYSTMDKNDFVVCIKCREHKRALQAIKELQKMEKQIVYSYSVLSIHSQVLEELNEEKYGYLYGETIDSICLKGVTNSYNGGHNIRLDEKYMELCNDLVDALYGMPQIVESQEKTANAPKKVLDEQNKDNEKQDSFVYDILGDDDFRLIARNVKLGRLLEQYKKDNLLGYHSKKFRFYLYSSSMVLNTKNENISPLKVDIPLVIENMDKAFQPEKCIKLEEKIPKILGAINSALRYDCYEKKVIFCQAMWQQLQSLKALESAPTKKYDFYSLYHPFSALARILEKKMDVDDLGECADIYEFIHKISMTLHGTMRTDIRFFQIRDFNAIVHYAPAKLRSFYAIWALKLSEYYNDIGKKDEVDLQNKYSFIFSPGMFGKITVRQLLLKEASLPEKLDEDDRLMLITVPERHLYSTRWLMVILSHEISHFVGRTIRNREMRHKKWLRISARILELEIDSFIYHGIDAIKIRRMAESMIKSDSYLLSKLKEVLFYEEREIRKEENKGNYEFHSKNSMMVIRKAYRKLGWFYLRKIISDYAGYLKKFLGENINSKYELKNHKTEAMIEIAEMCNGMEESIMLLVQKFQQTALITILETIRYISSEAFADMMAILTLNLAPKEYLESFVKGEPNLRLNGKEGASLNEVRIAIVIKAISELINTPEGSRWFDTNSKELKEKWSGNVLEELLGEFTGFVKAQNLALRTLGYQKYIVRHTNKIENYKSLYDYSEGVENFLEDKYDFFNDKIVYEELYTYVLECARLYVKKQNHNESSVKDRQLFVNTYRTIVNGTPIDMVQEIERFLFNFEKRQDKNNAEDVDDINDG